MVKMFLRRLDKRQKDIEIPSGKTVIGRGPLLGCADKKVSRNHAILDVHDGGKMDLLATHINPCFYQPQAKGEVRILKKDDKVHILPGDAIMLLRDSFKFKVIVKEDQKDINKKGTEGLNDQSSTQDLSKQLGYSSELDSDNSHEQERKKKKTETNDDEWNGHTSNELGVLCRQDKVCEKLQVLKNETDVQISVENESGTQLCSVEENFPQLSAEKQSVSTPDVNKESVCLQGESTSLHPQNKTSIWGSSPKNEVTSPPQENISSERKRTLPSWLVKVTTSSEGKLGTQKPVPEIVQSDKSVEDRKGKRCVRKRTDSFHDSEFEDKGKECSRKYDSSSDSGGGQETYKNRSKERPGSDEEELTVTPRRSCRFGDKCYRNNPSHFEEFSHPGDQDFVETKDTSSDNEENKPECQYGVECYRKNRKHRQKYSHTKKVRPKRNAARKGCQKQQADNEDSDSYIDDSDVYEPSDSDSDWNPDEESDEDIGRLVREAKGFMKNKRL